MTRRGVGEKLYNQLYGRLIFDDEEDAYKCYYCGEPASTNDHQPPISLIEGMLDGGRCFEAVKVPCCAECNNILHASKTYTLEERLREAKKLIERRYRKHISAYYSWQDEELNELGKTLRSMIKASIVLGGDAVRRLAYKSPEYNSIKGHEIVQCQNCLEYTYSDEEVCLHCGGRIDYKDRTTVQYCTSERSLDDGTA